MSQDPMAHSIRTLSLCLDLLEQRPARRKRRQFKTVEEKQAFFKAQFWAKAKGLSPETCWEWTGARSKYGYGVHSLCGRVIGAHRVAWFFWTGSLVPRGAHLDHLCRNRACVNPGHLEPVTPRENVLRGEGHAARNARKTHCPQGHELVPGNLVSRPRRRSRECRICHNANVRRRRANGK